MRLILTLCSMVLGTVAIAAAPTGKWYQVEVLVFEQPQGETVDESLPLVPGRPSRKNTVDLRPFSAENQEDGFMIVPNTQWALQDTKKRLPRVLLHTRWRQWMTTQKETIPVHVWGGKNYSTPTLPDFTDLAPPALIVDRSETSVGPYPWEIEGNITIWLARYLHVEADVVYQKEAKNPHPYRLTESRRLRSNELHYLDHPYFGMLILLTPEKEVKAGSNIS